MRYSEWSRTVCMRAVAGTVAPLEVGLKRYEFYFARILKTKDESAL